MGLLFIVSDLTRGQPGVFWCISALTLRLARQVSKYNARSLARRLEEQSARGKD